MVICLMKKVWNDLVTKNIIRKKKKKTGYLVFIMPKYLEYLKKLAKHMVAKDDEKRYQVEKESILFLRKFKKFLTCKLKLNECNIEEQ